MGDEKAHSKIGASSAHRWINCPGSNNLIAQLGAENTSSEYADWGSCAHLLAEENLKMFKMFDLITEDAIGRPSVAVGKTKIIDGTEITIDQEMVDVVVKYIVEIKKMMAADKVNWPSLMVETGFELTQIDPEAHGTCDAAYEVPFRKVVVIDLKTGFNPVKVKNNPQLKYYALGLIYKLYGSLKDADIDEVESVVIQPRGVSEANMVSRHTYTINEMIAFEAELAESIKITRTSKDLKAGEWCKYCPAKNPSSKKSMCPKILDQAVSLAKVQFDTIGETKYELPEVLTLDAETVSKVLQFHKVFEEWASCVQAHAHSMAEQGTDIKGFKLVNKSSNRQWADEAEAEKKMVKDLPKDGAYKVTKKLLSPAQAETVYKKLKTAMPEVVKPYAGTTLVPEHDNRKAVQPAIEVAFEKIVDFDDLLN